MSREAATPISKYLASIDRRHSLLTTGGAHATTPLTPALARTFSFNETFLSQDQSLLSIPTPRGNRSVYDFEGGVSDRKRKKNLYEDDSEKLQQNCDDLGKLLRQTQLDLIDSKSAFTTLEHQKSAAEAAFKEKLISIECSNVDITKQWETALEKIKNLEEKVEQLEKKEQGTNNNLHEQRNAHSNMVCSLQNRILKLQAENCELKQKFDEEVNQNSETVRKLSNDLDGTERGAEKWIIESQSLKDQLTAVQLQLQKCQEELKESHISILKWEELKSKYDAVQNQTQATDEVVKKWENLLVNEQIKNKQLRLELDKVKKENETLSCTMSSEMLLREQISSLEKTVTYMTGELKEKVICDENRKALQKEINEWKDVASKLDPRCKTPFYFESVLRQSQNQLLEFKHDNSNLKLQLQSKVESALKLQGENASLREQVKLLKDLSEKQSEDLKKTSKRLVLIAKDRDSLKGLKESYEQEFEGHCSKALQERNKQLEGLISQFEALVNEDSAISKRQCEKCLESSQKIQDLSSLLKTAQQDLTQKTAHLLASQNELTKLESVDSDLSYKIISFGKNPSTMSIDQKLKEVLEENERLKAKLQKLTDESRLGLSDTMVEESQRLEEKLKTLERKHEILTDTYEYETGQLQTAIEKLFGFHIILVREPQSQIRLQSVTSPNPDDMFIFQAADNDWMLLETPVLELFRQEIDAYLLKAGNIPAFIAGVTVKYTQGISDENFEDKTDKNFDSSRTDQKSPKFDSDEDDEDVDDDDNREQHTDEDDEEDDQVEEEEGSENEHSGEEYSEEDEASGEEHDNSGNRNDEEDDDDDEIIMLD